MTIDEVHQLQHDLSNMNTEEAKSTDKYSLEQLKRDGYNKDKQRLIENMQKVYILFY